MPALRIWVPCYRPFMMGGNVRQPIATKVEAEGPFDLGKGFEGYLVVNPRSGKMHVACAISGGLVGSSIKEVRDDIAAGELKMMKAQVAKAKAVGDEAENLTPDMFWSLWKGE
jgi:hypothetical protein